MENSHQDSVRVVSVVLNARQSWFSANRLVLKKAWVLFDDFFQTFFLVFLSYQVSVFEVQNRNLKQPTKKKNSTK